MYALPSGAGFFNLGTRFGADDAPALALEGPFEGAEGRLRLVAGLVAVFERARLRLVPAAEDSGADTDVGAVGGAGSAAIGCCSASRTRCGRVV